MKVPARRSGVVLIATLLVIAVAVLIGTAMALAAEGNLVRAQRMRDGLRLRTLAWSGVQGVMEELRGQRDSILDGGAPTLTREWTLAQADGRIERVSLDLFGDQPMESELAKLDPTRATPEMLEKLPGLSPEVAKAVSDELRGKRIEAIEDVVKEFGALTPERFEGRPGNEGEDGSERAGLGRLLTVFAFDPNVQFGLGKGPEAGQHLGADRVSRAIGWSAAIDQALGGRLSAGAKAGAERVLKLKQSAHRSDLVRSMLAGGVSADDMAEVLDLITCDDDRYVPGRVDLSNAPASVLACVPGITAEAAARIVETRQTLSPEAKRLVTWPLREGILDAEAFTKACDWLTTRTAFWRVRVRAELAPEGDGRTGEPEPGHGPQRVWEAVIDISEPQPRVAFLRDVTYLREMSRAREQARAAAPPAEEPRADVPDGPPKEKSPEKEPIQPKRLGNSGRSGEDQAPKAEPTSPEPAGLRDRRVGRWTNGRSGT